MAPSIAGALAALAPGQTPGDLPLSPPQLALAAALIAAAVIDARSRRFPNALAALALVLGALAAVWPVLAALPAGAGAPPAGELAAALAARLLSHAVPASLAAGALTALEVGWRARRGSAGLGMGDVKLLAALMLADPLTGLTSFAAALALLALACVLARRPSLPLIPFIALTWLPALLL